MHHSATRPRDHRQQQQRGRRSASQLAVLLLIWVLVGCAGDSGAPGGRGAAVPVATKVEGTAPPATQEAVLEAPPATQPDVVATATPPQPIEQVPATAPVTEPAVAETDTNVESQPRLRLVEDPTPAQVAIAQILAGSAASTLERQSPDLLLAQAASVLEAAVRLAPRDERLARQLVSARLLLGDVPEALEAVEHYRRLRPDDLLAQIRYVDLSAAQMESADAKLSYLVEVAQTQRVPAEVRSHAAVSASVLLREAMDEQGADGLLEQAVSLDPYNPPALQMFYERLLQTGAPRARRVDALALLARSNVVQPAVLQAMAEELGSAGLTEQANEMYLRTVGCFWALGISPPLELARDIAALQLVGDRPDPASQTIASALQGAALADAQTQAMQTSVVADLHLLQLLVGRRFAASPEQQQVSAEKTANLLRFGLNRIGATVHAAPQPTTNPDGSAPQAPLGDVVADATLLASEPLDPARQPLKLHYAALLANLAWVDLYFKAVPTDERIPEALALLVPPDSLTLRRIKGWQLWRQGQIDAARGALNEIGEDDPVARLGVLLLEAEAGTQIAAAANELLSSAPTGLTGAFLADALRSRGARVEPAADASEIRESLATLPAGLFGLIDPQSIRNHYSLTAEPRMARYEFGEPILMTVAIRNSGQHPLTIGPQGLIQPVVRLDALLKGQLQEPQAFPAAAAMELWGSVRLDSGEKIEQVVRLDGPVLSVALAGLPEPGLTISADVTTNPAIVQGEQGPRHVTGPAGQTRAAQRMITRTGFPIDLENPQLDSVIDSRLELLRTGEPLDRLRTAQWALGLLQSLGRQIQRGGEAADAAPQVQRQRELASRIGDALGRAASSLTLAGPDAGANSWVKYASAVVVPDSRERMLAEMLGAPAFEARIIGLLALSALAGETPTAERLVEPIAAGDEDLTVRQLAQDVLARLRDQAAQGPAAAPTEPAQTQPGTQPTPGGG